MAQKPRFGYSSLFDDMLEENKRQFDDLFRGKGRTRSSSSSPPAGPPQPSTASPSPAPEPAPSPPAPRARHNVPPDLARFLDDRYGDGWHYEVVEHHREGDEVIVLCKLVIEAQNVTKSQFGRAKVATPGGDAGVSGRMNGVQFSFKPGKAGLRGATSDPEEAAFREALGSALAKCVDML